MKLQNENRHMVDVLFVLTLFFVFALSTLTLVILGANIYKSTVNHLDRNFNDRTAYAYIAQKLRQSDESLSDMDTVTVCEFGDSTACVISSEINDSTYNTYLYMYDGFLCELMARSDLDIDPSGGSKILELNGFEVTNIDSSLLEITMYTTNDKIMQLYVSLHAAAEGGSDEQI